MSLSSWLFDPSGLTPHGFCLTWQPGLIALHAVSDAIVGFSYFSIPLAIASFVRRRPDLQYSWVAYLFVGFIMACGLTHLFSIVTLWVPAYGVEGLVKALTAGLSVATAALLWPLIPRFLALPSPAQLVRVNAELSVSLKEHQQTTLSLRESEARGRATNIELERRVAERTADLQAANESLREALADRDDALRSLARSEAEFRASFEGSTLGKVLAEPATRRIFRVNTTFADMLRAKPEDLVGLALPDLTYHEDAAVDAAEDLRLLNGEVDTHVREQRCVRRDGSIFWARVSATLARAPESDHPIVLVAAVEDIDARRLAATELLAAKQRLELALAERTAALDQRDLLLREVYHRVKNNLQIIDSLLAMQAQKLTHLEGRSALQSLRGRIYALGLVHHQLMESKDLKTFDIAPFLNELSKNILEGGASKGVTLRVDACRLDVGLDFAIPLGLVVTELVTNSLKHAFPQDAGTISVSLHQRPDQTLTLVVSDDGAGFSQSVTSSSHAGLGTRIVHGLVRQLEGTMMVRNDRGTTTEINLAMPVAS